jgi:glycerophosphoryl diester phosphodiesterase
MADRGISAQSRTAALLATLVTAVLLIGASVAEAASSYVHAHRGGPLETVRGKQKPALPEETLATLRKAAKAGYVVELDVKITADGVPVVIHDGTLDRTTNCEGNVGDITFAALRSNCEVDLLGTEGNDKQMKAKDKRRAPVPKLGQVLKMAKKNKARLNIEIKNFPGEPDYDPAPLPAYAKRIATRIKRSEFPAKKLIVQSFLPTNLNVIDADPYFAKAKISYLSLNATNEVILTAAAEGGADIISPGWPISQDYVDRAHALGLEVVPYTLDSEDDLREAASFGVDAVITNDPAFATRLYGAPR